MRARIFHPLVFLLLFAFQQIKASAPIGSLMMPVEFLVENGDYTKSILDVRKNGVSVLSKAGQHNMRLKLQYGNEYVLSFSKPGYITKQIMVNTNVSPEHGRQGFEPYKIGVKIFKQYEGVNIVVYNQPVGLINYHNELDEFAYDTDYTKSILSLLTATEKALEQKAAEEREQMRIAAIKKPVAKGEALADAVNNPVKNTSPDPVKNATANAPSGSKINNADHAKAPVPVKKGDAEDAGKTKTALNGEDPQKKNNAVAESETPSSAKPVSGQDAQPQKESVFVDRDTVQFSASKNIDDLPVIRVRTKKEPEKDLKDGLAKGNDVPSAKQIQTNGKDIPTSVSAFRSDKEFAPDHQFEKQHVNRTIEKTVESNRIITTIRLTEGDHITEYKRIVYNWGGEYFFVNKTTPISEHVFDVNTGE